VSIVYRELKKMKKKKLYKDKEWLGKEYWRKHRTLENLAKDCGCFPSTIARVMEKFGIDRRKSSVNLPTKEEISQKQREGEDRGMTKWRLMGERIYKKKRVCGTVLHFKSINL